MILRVLGPLTPREPLLFLLWMTMALSTSEFGAMRISNEPRSRKNANLNPTQIKSHVSNLPIQNDFPYRYVFPANHPFSAFTQYLSTHPTPPSAKSHNNYDIYATGSTPQQYHSNQLPEYKYLFKPSHHYHQNAQPYSSPNPVPVSPIPFPPTPSPVILLLHAGQPGGGPFQTFVLIPADSNQPLNNLPVSQSQPYSNLPTIQFATNPPFNNVGIPVRPNMLPVSTATIPSPVLTHSPQYLKPANNHYSNQINAPMVQSPMIQRPVNLYQLNGNYYPQKKNSIESKISSIDNEKSESRVSTSTERNIEKINIGNRFSRLKSNSTVE